MIDMLLSIRKVAAAMVLVLMTLVLSVATPLSASAVPSGCTHWIGTDGRGYARCTSGSGYYRVGIGCAAPWTLGYGYTQWGNWARVGGGYQSVASCPLGAWPWPTSGTRYSYLEKVDNL